MRKFHYRQSTGDITLMDTLQVVQLNEPARLIFDLLRAGGNRASVAQALVNEYDIDLETALTDSQEVLRDLEQLGISTANVGVSRQAWTPKTAIVHIIKNCNSACSMCDCWQTKGNVRHSRAALFEYFKILKEHGCSYVMISGGEPLLHPELKGILEDLKTLGLGRSLNTNSLLLSRHTWLREIGLEQLVSSMDGIDAASYRRFRGANAFNIVWKNLREFKAASSATNVMVRTTVNRSNYDKLDVLFDMVQQNGLDGVGFSPADIDSKSFARASMNEQRALNLRDMMLPTAAEIDQFLVDFHSESPLYVRFKEASSQIFSQWDADGLITCMKFYRNIWLNVPTIFNSEPCLFPNVAMVLDYDGELKSCFYSDSFGNLADLKSVDWSLESRLEQLKKSSPCSTCRGKIFCDVAKL